DRGHGERPQRLEIIPAGQIEPSNPQRPRPQLPLLGREIVGDHGAERARSLSALGLLLALRVVAVEDAAQNLYCRLAGLLGVKLFERTELLPALAAAAAILHHPGAQQTALDAAAQAQAEALKLSVPDK